MKHLSSDLGIGSMGSLNTELVTWKSIIYYDVSDIYIGLAWNLLHVKPAQHFLPEILIVIIAAERTTIEHGHSLPMDSTAS
jgi:hypothetical protein